MFNMNVSPLVSIILPTYNRAAFILETIESIRNQTFENWELIIVDDGSDDNTEELISMIKDNRIQFYKAGKIGIGGKIKNMGLKMASGELYAFMDSDDLWADTKLEKQVAALQQYPIAGFSLTGGFNFRKYLEPVEYFYEQREGIKCGDLLVPYFKSQVSATTPSLIFKRECLNITGYFDETIFFSDVDFILNLAMHFKGIILYEPLLYRRLHDSNTSSATWEIGYQNGITLIHSYRNIIPKAIAIAALFRLYINFGEDYISHKKTKKAITQFFKAWKNKPLSIVPFKKSGKALLYHVKNK